jgi:hypothetical protein
MTQSLIEHDLGPLPSTTPRPATPTPATDASGASLSLELRADGRLWATAQGRVAPVKLRRCFPWTAPDRYVSLQTEDNVELALVTDPAYLDAASRLALSRALADIGFVLQILRVHALREEFELRCFDVDTPQGRRTFQTALDAWPRETPDGGLLIEDVAGDLFRIDDPEKLDPRSRELVWELVD